MQFYTCRAVVIPSGLDWLIGWAGKMAFLAVSEVADFEAKRLSKYVKVHPQSSYCSKMFKAFETCNGCETV